MTQPARPAANRGVDGDLTPSPCRSEYSALLAQYGRVQQRCSEALAAQARQVTQLEAELMRLHAQCIVQTTELALQLEANQRLTGLVNTLQHQIMPSQAVDSKEPASPEDLSSHTTVPVTAASSKHKVLRLDGSVGHSDAALESSLAAADWVICQVACVSQQAYWRVQDHCRRTGKTCVLLHTPGAALTPGSVPESCG